MRSQRHSLLCVSVDSTGKGSLSTEAIRRQRDLIAILERFETPSNWTIEGNMQLDLPPQAELTVEIPKGLQRSELLRYLRQMNAFLLRDQTQLRTAVLDPHEARRHWDLLVRQGCEVVRPRSAEVTKDTGPRILRGGLWITPLSCSFVGGSRRSVRSLFSLCQRRLVDAAKKQQLFHLNVDVAQPRDSWPEECAALKALLETATEQQRKGRMSKTTLGQLPNILTKKTQKPLLSILKAA